MSGWLPLAITAGTVLALIGSGFWANKRFADFNQLPGHYDFAGRATRLTSRRTMVWLLPITFSVVMVAVFAAIYLVKPEYRTGDPLMALVISAVALLGSQVFVIWLTDRWAKQQRKDR